MMMDIFGDAAYGRANLPDYVKDTFGWFLQTILRPVGLKGSVSVAEALDCGTHLRLARSLPPSQQGLREDHRIQRSGYLHRHDHPHVQAAHNGRKMIFKTPSQGRPHSFTRRHIDPQSTNRRFCALPSFAEISFSQRRVASD
jgi:hypothetical protein